MQVHQCWSAGIRGRLGLGILLGWKYTSTGPQVLGLGLEIVLGHKYLSTRKQVLELVLGIVLGVQSIVV